MDKPNIAESKILSLWGGLMIYCLRYNLLTISQVKEILVSLYNFQKYQIVAH
jgi:hypothetical protein